MSIESKDIRQELTYSKLRLIKEIKLTIVEWEDLLLQSLPSLESDECVLKWHE